jgi:hypothetical protein
MLVVANVGFGIAFIDAVYYVAVRVVVLSRQAVLVGIHVQLCCRC